ncbi:Crp/Fnr family transcriptional regulator [Ferribacterium limneticum]|uniref:Crp/Fnr family transcriptional regulator n=1 Tax=Ferribacterium limneticum TaxID=76259 RepID=UPI001CFA9553|nr:Crp/Fnr family transcriptional regulator [Ferribacterium limneticum]UCV27199.1 Crp/Fnr family transcriptional regulator [Ferribacterium limneticum]UCV31116.1 Crp/Fnr family transcriptional regulator [Ferribacterium limneticum]
MATTPCGLSLVVLRNVPLFSGLDDIELEKLSKVSGRKRVERGASVVRAGDSTDSLYILLSGRAKVTNTDEDGREIILAWLGPSEFFGEMGLIDGSPRSANVVAAEACELLFLSKDSFQRCLQDNFQVAQKLMKTLVLRLREADRKIESLALLDVYGRVARLLLDMSELVDGRRVIKKKMSKQDMAKMIGASREMVSKVMRDLELSGYIRIENDLTVIPGA